MRTIAAGPFSSLDGVAEAPRRRACSQFNDEMGAAVAANVAAADPLLLGRESHDGLAEAFRQGSARR